MLLLDPYSPLPQNSAAVPRQLALKPRLYAILAASALILPAVSAAQQSSPVLLDAMTTELHRAFTSLGKQGDESNCRLTSSVIR